MGCHGVRGREGDIVTVARDEGKDLWKDRGTRLRAGRVAEVPPPRNNRSLIMRQPMENTKEGKRQTDSRCDEEWVGGGREMDRMLNESVQEVPRKKK